MEHFEEGVPVFEAHQIREANVLAEQALTLVEQQFGSGYPLYHGGKNGGLAYHNRHHSESVRLGSDIMGEAFGLTKTERVIGAVAAAAHDIVQLKPRGVMEQESAEWLEARLRKIGVFPGLAIAAGTLAILGTEPVFEGGKITGQVVSRQEYPSLSAERIALGVACGDFAELYAPAGPLVSHDLYKEIQGVSPADTPSMEGLLGFQRFQADLLENFRYPHAIGDQVFGIHRRSAIEYTIQLCDQLERGDIESWQQLIDQDKAFMRTHSQ